MADILAELQLVAKLNGDTYSSSEVIGMVRRAADEIERLRAGASNSLCPGGGYTGQPEDEHPTVAACLKAGVCGCDTGALLNIQQPIGGGET